MSPEAPRIWKQPFRVRAYEVGPGDIASPLAVINYLQEAAGEHANVLGIEHFDVGEQGAAWVLSRLSMHVERLPRWREDLVLETWPSGREGLRATRDLLLQTTSGEVLVRARTVWFVLDLARRRPIRLPPPVIAIEPPRRDPALVLGPEPLAPEAASSRVETRVRRSDLDRNEHANNARFAQWALSATPGNPDWGRLRSLDLAFKGEALLGDLLHIEASGQALVSHAIFRAHDHRLLATATTTWA